MRVVGRYVLDTLQIFFPWDDDLYTYFKEHGLGSSGLKSEKLPLIYTDNCESTGGIPERKRNNVIGPHLFGTTYQELNWKSTGRETQPIIPAERPELEIDLLESTGSPSIELKIVPSLEGVEQYHLEYSSMSSFGRIYKNWATMYIPTAPARELSSNLQSFVDRNMETAFSEESKQAQREKFRFLGVGVARYQFSYSGFAYATRYFEKNGVHGPLPSLVYDSTDPISREMMDPLLKVGVIETKSTEGFETRKPQIAMKLSQPKFTNTKRGLRGRAKGRIIENLGPANSIVVSAADFATKLSRVLQDPQDSG